ncbi:MAG: LD-carboxypeptidase [Candidatus Gastranaerophilales bacterium]|nr:LD-carboxypeptidase [Candidatus Gastranaerophilales bacterium]
MSLNKIYPKVLQKGDKIAFVSPAGSVSYQEKFEKAQAFFENAGYSVVIMPNSRKINGYLAGDDEDRLEDLMSAFSDTSINAIIANRGGYGCLRLLDKIDYNVIKNNPKIFVGYSDITALHCAFYKYAGLVTFHGAFSLDDFGCDEVDEYTKTSFFETLEGKNTNKPLENKFAYTSIVDAEVQAPLSGGNLTVLCSLLQTPYFPDLKGRVLFLEDVAEPLYKIDRMLYQLELAGILGQIKGLLIGKFSGLCENQTKAELLLFEMLEKLTSKYKIPAGYGFSAGHETSKATLPLNVEYYFNSLKGELKILEQPVLFGH